MAGSVRESPWSCSSTTRSIRFPSRKPDTRIVQAAGLRFEYPRMMSFEYEKDLFSKTRTLDENDAGGDDPPLLAKLRRRRV